MMIQVISSHRALLDFDEAFIMAQVNAANFGFDNEVGQGVKIKKEEASFNIMYFTIIKVTYYIIEPKSFNKLSVQPALTNLKLAQVVKVIDCWNLLSTLTGQVLPTRNFPPDPGINPQHL